MNKKLFSALAVASFAVSAFAEDAAFEIRDSARPSISQNENQNTMSNATSKLDFIEQNGQKFIHVSTIGTVDANRQFMQNVNLVNQQRQQIAVKHRMEHAPQDGKRQLEAGMLLYAHHAEGYHRHVAVAGLFQRLAQERDVIGRAAAAAGLEVYQRRLMRIVLAAFQRAYELTYHQQRRIAGVVVNILEPGLDYLGPLGLQQLGLIPRAAQNLQYEPKMQRQHVRRQYRVRRLHLRRELHVVIRLHCFPAFPPVRR